MGLWKKRVVEGEGLRPLSHAALMVNEDEAWKFILKCQR